jgi:hypothetical protein
MMAVWKVVPLAHQTVGRSAATKAVGRAVETESPRADR